MQTTRRQIINLLNERGKATVDELAEMIGLTPMAVRHHLNVLQADNLVSVTKARRQGGPGRPAQLYGLTETADRLFPTDYCGLTDYVLTELGTQLGREEVSRIFQGIAQRFAAEAPPWQANQTVEERLDELVAFLGQKGFAVSWQAEDDAYVIHAYSCPYRRIAKQHQEVCMLDQQVINSMLNSNATRTACLNAADGHCTYKVRKPITLVDLSN